MEESTQLRCQEGNSDKAYHIRLIAKDDGYILHAANGRYGSTMVPQIKIAEPVPYEKAKKAYDKLKNEKMRKGYIPQGESSSAFVSPGSRKKTGTRCQRLNPIEEKQFLHLLEDSNYALEEKFDGRRMPVGKKDGEVYATNLQGLECGIPECIKETAEGLDGNHTLDGEAVGETLFVFDILTHEGKDLSAYPFRERKRILSEVIRNLGNQTVIQEVKTSFTTEEKKRHYQTVMQRGGEGVVLKNIHSTITPGKEHSDQWKFKFYESASCIVTGKNEKRSVRLGLFDDAGKKMMPAGNVTIPANHEVPETGSIVEVRYLYAFKESGALFQPTYLGQRTDIPGGECTQEQLKYKTEESKQGTDHEDIPDADEIMEAALFSAQA